MRQITIRISFPPPGPPPKPPPATPGPGPSSQVEPNHLSVRPSIRRAASNRPTRGARMNGHRPNVRMRHHSPDAAACYNGSGLFALFNEMEIIFLIIAEVTFSAGDFPLFLGPSVGVVTHATQARYRASRHKVKISRGYRRHQHGDADLYTSEYCTTFKI